MPSDRASLQMSPAAFAAPVEQLQPGAGLAEAVPGCTMPSDPTRKEASAGN